ncbi:MAG: chalcone isomerase family protein [Methylococcales bacterium]
MANKLQDKDTTKTTIFACLNTAGAGTLAGVTLPDRIDGKGQSLVLNGLGVRSKFFIDVYVGGLYLPQQQKDAQAILSDDTPYRMVMHFLYGVSQDQMCAAWAEGLEGNTPQASAEVKKAFATLGNWMEAIPNGNELVLTYTYVPGLATTVEINGKAKGILPGAAVADAILATWIGPDPGPGEEFKKAVLGE